VDRVATRSAVERIVAGTTEDCVLAGTCKSGLIAGVEARPGGVEAIPDRVIGDACAVVDEMARICSRHIRAVGEHQVGNADELIGSVGRTGTIVGHEDRRAG